MSETINHSVELDTNAPKKHYFENFNDFILFEDNLINQIISEPNAIELRDWRDNRENIKNIVKPKNFSGIFKNIVAEEMQDPIVELMEVHANKLSFHKNYIVRQGLQTDCLIEKFAHNLIGYNLSFDAYNPGTEKVGQVLSQVWYSPVPEHFNINNKSVKENQTIRRIFTNSIIVNNEIGNIETSNYEKIWIYSKIGQLALAKINRQNNCWLYCK